MKLSRSHKPEILPTPPPGSNHSSHIQPHSELRQRYRKESRVELTARSCNYYKPNHEIALENRTFETQGISREYGKLIVNRAIIERKFDLPVLYEFC
ncbi:hypothetical protein AND_001970 [Anopheles darlingi]|uniref:Uncharacterized protein n=1 Tax=Anopheles darlingi TaxID=43151 RepID=W5JPD3_ANODA|nr:hypothetical protein AND_001970 [Anopheles darlingi]